MIAHAQENRGLLELMPRDPGAESGSESGSGSKRWKIGSSGTLC